MTWSKSKVGKICRDKFDYEMLGLMPTYYHIALIIYLQFLAPSWIRVLSLNLLSTPSTADATKVAFIPMDKPDKK